MSRVVGVPAIVPSRVHETRRVLLETVADAAGYRLPMPLPDGRRPDVLRLHIDRAGFFLGEAKHTEGPDDFKSLDRLRHYLGWLLPLCPRAVRSVLAVAHPRSLGSPWRERVAWLCQGLPLGRVVGSVRVTPLTTVTCVVLGPVDWRYDPPGTARTGRSRRSEASPRDTRHGRGRQR